MGWLHVGEGGRAPCNILRTRSALTRAPARFMNEMGHDVMTSLHHLNCSPNRGGEIDKQLMATIKVTIRQRRKSG